MPSYRHVWLPPYLATITMPGYYYGIRMALDLYAHYFRVEISRIDRFRAYLEGGIRGRSVRDLPSRASIIELQKFTIAREVAGEVARGTV